MCVMCVCECVRVCLHIRFLSIQHQTDSSTLLPSLPTFPFLVLLLKFYRTIKSTSLGTIDIADENNGMWKEWAILEPYSLLVSCRYEYNLLIMTYGLLANRSRWDANLGNRVAGGGVDSWEGGVHYLNLEREAVTGAQG